MRLRRWVLFIALNIIVSILTTLGVLSLKGELERVVVVTATPGAMSVARIPTAVPAGETAEPVTSPTAPDITEYIIQDGDTLGYIALQYDVALEDLLLANNLSEDAIIQPGDKLIIPSGEIVVTPVPATPSAVPETPSPETSTPISTATPTPPGPLEVRIEEVVAPGNLAREGVVLINRGRTVNLYQWTLGAAGSDDVYVFPRLTLAREVPVTIYTVAGDDSPQALHWGLEEARWGESDTVVELRDAGGNLVARYTVP